MRCFHWVIAVIFGWSPLIAAEKPQPVPVMPDGLKSDLPEIPAEQNQLLRFLELPPSNPDLVKRTSSAEERLKKGERVEDAGLMDELRKRHLRARETLKPPLAFTPTQPLFTVPLFGLFKGSEVLARQALLERDFATADAYLDDLLRWSRLLRHARPNITQWLTPRYAWKTAFDILLENLPCHPEPAKRLDGIKERFRENPIESTELMEVVKAEARWELSEGGIRGFMEKNENVTGAIFLKPPFNELKRADLDSLSYDFEADFRRDTADLLAILTALKQNTPISEWPNFQPRAVERTFEDYKRRPNGLGDLNYEQSDSPVLPGFWNSALSGGRLLDGCLRWLETERGGGVVREALFADLLDPVDGKPLSIDLQQRTIRGRGVNRKSDPREPELGPLPAAGFTISGDDPVMIVPRWNAASKVGN